MQISKKISFLLMKINDNLLTVLVFVPDEKGYAFSRLFRFLGIGSNISGFFIQFCSPIICQFRLKNSFDFVQIRVSYQS